MTEELPSFNQPPVNEVVMGVQFQALSGLLAPHVGKFWSMVGGDYPQCSEHPPITSAIENFEAPGAVVRLGLTLSTIPDLPRVFFEDATGQWLIQIQRDRFLHNWRAGADDAIYPRYPEVKRRFFEQWGRFQEFIQQNNLGTVQITQLEITYLNRIPLSSSKLREVFPDFQWRVAERSLSPPESMSVLCSFKSDGAPKRLRVSIKPAIHQDQQVMRFELTVRGGLFDGEAPEDWFSDGRAWIVRAFADLTSEAWHSKWGRSE